jgi:transcriptional regulator with XRE-family HTH domain
MTPERIIDARQAAGLTQAAAAELVHLGGAIRWSEYERGVRNIDPARWELFQLLTNQHPKLTVRARHEAG